MKRTYTVSILPEPGSGYVVEVPALPGCTTYGRTITEALQMAEDAIGAYVAVLLEDGDTVPRERGEISVNLGGRSEAWLRKVTVSLA